MGGALEARGIGATGDQLKAVAVGEVEVEEGVLVLRRIGVAFTLEVVDAEAAAAARRVHEVFKPQCPIYRSIHRAIDVTTKLLIHGH